MDSIDKNCCSSGTIKKIKQMDFVTTEIRPGVDKSGFKKKILDSVLGMYSILCTLARY